MYLADPLRAWAYLGVIPDANQLPLFKRLQELFELHQPFCVLVAIADEYRLGKQSRLNAEH
jgi:hypothetical protein